MSRKYDDILTGPDDWDGSLLLTKKEDQKPCANCGTNTYWYLNPTACRVCCHECSEVVWQRHLEQI